jgi:hypothetical protein
MGKKRFAPDVWRLLIDGVEEVVRDVRELRRRIVAALRKQFAEVQLVRGERPEHNLFGLFNNDHAVLSYTRNIDEASFSARSNDVGSAAAQSLEFFLSNGQCDEYPVAETISSADAAKAFDYFFKQENLPPWIKWHKDF